MGELDSFAQSRGEWPGVSRTFLRGLAGMEVCVGGGAREDDAVAGVRFGIGRGPRLGGGGIMPCDCTGCVNAGTGFSRGGARPPEPVEALWAEFAAGKEGAGRVSISSSCPKAKDGTVGVVGDSTDVSARGLVGGESGCFCLLKSGGGGGGIALRSKSAMSASLGFRGVAVLPDTTAGESLAILSRLVIAIVGAWSVVAVGASLCGLLGLVFSIAGDGRRRSHCHCRSGQVEGGCL